MTRHVAPAYAAAGALLVLFLAWAAISASPWASATAPAVDPRVAALQRREAALRHEAVVVRRMVRHRWAVYRVRLARRNHEIALVEQRHQRAVDASRAAAAARMVSAPSASVVTVPALTVTRTS